MKKILLLFLFVITAVTSFALSCAYPEPPNYMIRNEKVYYHRYNIEEDIELSELDVKKVKFINVNRYDVYAKDDKYVYYHDAIIENADANTFEVMGNESVSKDKKNVYYGSEKLNGIDVKTFEIIMKPIKPHPAWGYGCSGREYGETYKDKNGKYTINDFQKLIQK